MTDDRSFFYPSAGELLRLDGIAPDRFRAARNLDNFAGKTFGGQSLAQALLAARHTVPGDWPANNLSGMFLRAGKLDRPLDFAVERMSDSARLASRRVVASQEGRPIFDLLCSFHDGKPGVEHQFTKAGDAPSPENLLSLGDWAKANADHMAAATVDMWMRPFPVELRLIDPESMLPGPGGPQLDFWFRMPSAADVADAVDHQALLALMSDYLIASAITSPYDLAGRRYSLVSLNHAMWFHAPARADEWLLHRTRSHWAANSRGLAQGMIFDREGRLIATTSQEAMFRIA